jgi:hypothetical protein
MTPNYRGFLSVGGLLALCLACAGGQTGEPSAHNDVECIPRDKFSEELPYPGCDCRGSDWDEEFEGVTPREAIARAELHDLPLFWTSRADEADGYRHLEAKDVNAETRLNLALQPDPERRVAVCNGGLHAPVIAKLETADGLEVSFAGTVNWDAQHKNFYFSNASAHDTFPWQDGCAYQLLPTGTFCHPEHGRATWPTPCGGEQQVPLDVATDPAQPSLEEYFEGAESLTLLHRDSSPNLPDITLSFEFDDETACYVYRDDVFDAIIAVETDGVMFSSRVTFHRGEDFLEQDTAHAQSAACGDVSGSAAWDEVQSELGGARRLCVWPEYRRDATGLTAVAEVDLDSERLNSYTSVP